jgi:PhnB protein
VIGIPAVEVHMKLQPYVFFEGRCDEALAFYRSAVGAEVTSLMRYKEMPERDPAMCSDSMLDKVVHASVKIGGTEILVSDGRCQGTPNFRGFSFAITAATDAEADRFFAALADGGTVQMPMAKTFFSSRFGMLADRFGVGWMVLVG